MSGVFETVEAAVAAIIALSFMDDFRFLACGKFAQNVAKILQLVGKKVIELGQKFAVIYEMDKTEAVLFSKAQPQNLADQIQNAKIKIGRQIITFNKKAT